MHFYGNGSAGRMSHGTVVILAVISLVFPSSASVLCIAPGGHVAIEDLGAVCCVFSDISYRTEGCTDDAFAATGNCRNCTDYTIALITRGAVLDSCSDVAPKPLARGAGTNHIPPGASLSSAAYRPVKYDARRGPVCLTASVPLRC